MAPKALLLRLPLSSLHHLLGELATWNWARRTKTQGRSLLHSRIKILFQLFSSLLVKMPPQLLVWLIAFIMQSGLLGVCMYQLVQLTDLEADYINPHDACKGYNNLVVSEIITFACLLPRLLPPTDHR